MTGLTWVMVALGVAWVVWIIRVFRILKREDDLREMDEQEREEDRRRRALGYVTEIDAWRQIERQPAIRRTGRR
jgi:hypothetical protein